MKVLVTSATLNKNRDCPAMLRLREFADEIVYNPYGRPMQEDEIIPLLDGCEGYLVGLDYVTSKVIDGVEGLRVISRYGSGTDRVDLAAATRKGIPVCNTPAVNAQAVADLTMGLMLAVSRRIPMLDRQLKAGRWIMDNGTEIYRKTLGILGLGNIGKAVAKRARGFDMRVIACDPVWDEVFAAKHEIERVDFDRLITEPDIVSLHLPLQEDTRGMLSRSVMEQMKPGAILINTARGGIVDEDAVLELLRSGRIAGLGVDVYQLEPPGDDPLLGLDNVVATPHVGAHSVEASRNMADMAIANLIDVLSGRRCANIVNGL